MNIADLRNEYRRETLEEADVAPDPFVQFGRWFDAAVAVNVPEPNAMTLATIGAALRPDARIVLLKGVAGGAFQFFTNYRSRKGCELEARSSAALVFFWAELERQIRIDGEVSRLAAADSDAYFVTRPRGSRLAAWASPQSETVANRRELESRFAAVEERFRDAGEAIPRPPHWGGYRLVPATFEFWQGRPSRLHDRIRYRRGGDSRWIVERLAP